jgi:hypothetical protein
VKGRIGAVSPTKTRGGALLIEGDDGALPTKQQIVTALKTPQQSCGGAG